LFNAVSYVAVLFALAAMRDLPRRERAASPPMLRSLVEGFQYAFRFAPVRNLLLMPALLSLIGIPLSTLLPVYSNDVLHGGALLFGFLTGASGAGALASALYLISRKSVLGLGSVITYTSAGFGATLIAFAASRSIPLSLVLMFVAGFCMMLQMGASNTLLQTIVEEDKRGRVLSLYATAFMGTAPIGSLIAGWSAERFGPSVTLSVGGVTCLGAAILFARALPQMRDLVRPIYRMIGVLPPLVEQAAVAAHTAVAAETTAELATARERPL
jgi:MFS family permease